MRAASPAHILLAAAVFALASPASSESTNARPCDNGAGPPNDPAAAGYDERLIGVCQLENTDNTFAFKPSIRDQGNVTFAVRSCSPDGASETCEFATPYAVRLTGPTTRNGKKFVLEGAQDEADVTLTYSSSGISEALSPGEFSGLFPGGANGQLVPATINVSLQNLGKLKSTTYSGTFTLGVDQCGDNDSGGPTPCDGTKPVTRLATGEEVTFTINLVIDAEIRISGLEDMALVADGTGAYLDSQQFCVYTTSGALYRITADSQNGSGNFLLQGTTQSLQYETVVSALAGSSEALQEAVISSNTWLGHPQPDCNGYAEENMRIDIRVPPAEIGSATETSYSDTLTLTVEVE
ncbi:hypothetical protein AWR36_005575 [Microbulbifer flavimaris]|uniref:Spore coat protein U domain-containing protein n=1 Tax=Microbulbifer flavimaris TaxID=1781068 RepID=A0ABX4HZT9_9GAMM|nr:MULTISPECIES: hypothetical protein [Microbulbifer]KUJ83333.1 hypothetical protein AVO43_05565 [Microbulbifer sp. ZGT114]PCO05488.1 hypothetical protein AWR36_005575 [Microbulbifer flavimaris]